MKKSNKKPLLALVLIALIAVIGGTWAYFTSAVDFTNIFKTETYKTSSWEEFTSPEDWKPGQTVDKNVFVKNEGNVEVAVRVRYEESWDRDLPLQSGGKDVAQIQFNNTNWTSKAESDGKTWYYYTSKLAKNAQTTSFITGVKLNPEVEFKADQCTGSGTKESPKVCTTSDTSYAGATYTLKVYIETVQYDSYQTAWNTTVTIN